MKKKPEWLKVKTRSGGYSHTENMLQCHSLHSVCQEAKCPNQNECFSQKTAAFMILGTQCTRNCTFCAVEKNSNPNPPDETEPLRLAQAVKELGLDYVVITSVTRDDLPDGGAQQFAAVTKELHNLCPHTSVELLIPDFISHLSPVIEAKPWIINHNIETVERLYPEVRPKASYVRSLSILKTIKETANMQTKSGFMLGLGETEKEIFQLLEDLRNAHCDFLTIGQYLQPTKNHHEVIAYIPPHQFDHWREVGTEFGFKHVASGPLVRSSYHAKETIQASQKIFGI